MRKRFLPILVCAALLLSAAGPARAGGSGYTDVSGGEWYAEAVTVLRENGIMEGVGDNRFDPGGALSRAQLAAVLYRLAGRPSVSGEDGFADTESGVWYSDAVLWASRSGVIRGYGSGLFGPADPTTQEQLAVMLWRRTGADVSDGGYAVAAGTEAAASDWAADAVRWARAVGLLTDAVRFEPFLPATRAQAADMVYRCLLLPEQPPNPDSSDRAEEAVGETAPGTADADARRCIVIDPGHQSHANLEKEALGPGSSEMKYKDSGGTWGRTSGTYEYELNLAVALLLRDELERRDYRVVLTRETNDADISNIERAAVAEREEADVFLRIHANGSDNPYVSGAIAICMTPGSPFNPELYPASRALSDCVLEAFTAATGARNSGVWETNSMTGINWSRVPVTILEMGYMTNPAEDLRMATPEYRAKMAAGIADGIDRFFELTMAQ